jgi:hypothetical protein
MHLFAPTQQICDLLSPSLMAIRICRIGVELCPAAIAIECDSHMAWCFGEVEIFNNPPLIEWIEQGFDSTTNTF